MKNVLQMNSMSIPGSIVLHVEIKIILFQPEQSCDNRENIYF